MSTVVHIFGARNGNRTDFGSCVWHMLMYFDNWTEQYNGQKIERFV